MVAQSDFLNNYCRICGEPDGICIDLMARCEENYLNKVQELLPLNINKNDKLPKNICHICLSTIDLFERLKQKCIKTQETLRDLARTFDQEEEESDIEILSPPIQDDDVVFIAKQTQNTIDKDADDTIDVDDYSSSEEKDDQDLEPKSSAFELKRSQDTSPKEEKCNVFPKLDGWTIQHIPGKGTTLYICNNCSEMLLYESAIKSHNCKESVLVTHIIPLENKSNNVKDEYADDDVNKKKRKRIFFAGED